ncbi:MAG: hypothetical protein KBA31_13575 [Alphaproteobacteria bacterium]|nr:hypothetical protein [Alphaproteobacteria bacterium]
MTKFVLSALAAGAMSVIAAAPAFAGQIYGNYGQYNAPPTYAAPAYGPAYAQPYRAGPAYGYERNDYRSCEGDRVAGTIIGGVIGGIIGNNIGRGHRHGHWGHRRHGNGGATVAGVLFGGLAGNAIASGSCRDRAYAPQAYATPYYGNAYAAPAYGPQYDEGYGPQYDEGYDEGYDPDAPYDAPQYGPYGR